MNDTYEYTMSDDRGLVRILKEIRDDEPEEYTYEEE